MTTKEQLLQKLEPILKVVASVDPADPQAALAKLDAALPLDTPQMQSLAKMVREGVAAKVFAEREGGGVRFGRISKDQQGLSIDLVHMDCPGPGHTHPNGEIDLCFAVSGAPTFDGRAPGWTVYPPNSWHVPTVAGGVMDILYFLPGGQIRFEPKPQA